LSNDIEGGLCHFNWKSGEEINQDFWAENEPTEFTNNSSTCVYLYDNKVFDAPCTFGYNVVCEMQ
jgi:hypothetical protein